MPGFSFNFATQNDEAKTKIPLHKKVKAKAAYKLPKAMEKKKNKKLGKIDKKTGTLILKGQKKQKSAKKHKKYKAPKKK